MRTLVSDPQVIAPNFKRRLSGVTTTLFRVAPVQARSVRIAVLGPVVPDEIPQMRFRDLLRLARRPSDRPFRIWHARRNVEMLAGVVLRDLLRFPLKLVFTSASQRKHTGWSRFLIGRMDAVVSVSDFTAAYLQRPSIVVMHGIDTAVFRPARAGEARPADLPPIGRLVGCFGRIRAQKGTDVFVDAMIRVLPDRPDVKAVVLGRATGEHQDFLDELKARVAAAGLNDRILFPGEVGPLETPAYYRALCLYVAPQRWEGFGVTPLEAMASGAPVVATTVGAFPKLVIDGETGSLIPPGDADAMAEAVGRWLDDDAARAKAGAAARSRVETQFSLEVEAEGINAVYQRLWDQA